MSIIASIIQRKNGLPSCHTELQHQALTQGHVVCESGLRGHSVGETWPYRVVGKGDGKWEVHRNGSKGCIVTPTCEEAHEFARTLKAMAVANAEARKRKAYKQTRFGVAYGATGRLS